MLCRREASAPAASAPPAEWRRLACGLRCRSVGHRPGFALHRFPVLDEIRRAAVNLEPGERLAEDVPMDERALCARAGRHVAQAALQAEQLAQTLDVPSRQRQIAQPWARRPLRPPR